MVQLCEQFEIGKPVSSKSPDSELVRARLSVWPWCAGARIPALFLGLLSTWNREFWAQNGLGWGPVTSRIRDKFAGKC